MGGSLACHGAGGPCTVDQLMQLSTSADPTAALMALMGSAPDCAQCLLGCVAGSSESCAASCLASKSGVTVGGSLIIERDVEVSNGIVHIVASPVTAVPDPHLLGRVGSDRDLQTLLLVLAYAPIVEKAIQHMNYTFFAPTNDAFLSLDPQALAALLRPESIAELEVLLFYHLLPLEHWSYDLAAAQRWTTADNSSLSVYVDHASSTVHVDRARVIEADIPASNGVVHVIDTVLVPPSCTPFPGAVLTT